MEETNSETRIRLMNRDQRSLLLYLESCAVDQGGILDLKRMSREDNAQVNTWAASKYVSTGRIAADYLRRGRSNWIRLSPQALSDAQAERRARIDRMWSNRNWLTTAEVRSGTEQTPYEANEAKKQAEANPA